MSIYISGVEMPTEGNETIIRIQPDGTVLDQYGHHLGLKAIPVQPHGRLIDADALGEFPYNMDFCDGGEADEWVRNAPTVISADPVKEGEG